MDIRQKTIDAFQQRFGAPPAFLARAPGRVNLLGEHVDYNDGFVLPAAIDRTTWVAFRPSANAFSTIVALDLADETAFDLAGIEAKKNTSGESFPTWALYPAGVAWSLNGKGLQTPPLEAVVSSDVPTGAGLSSSASVELAFCCAWQKLGGWDMDPMQMALACQFAENKYVGVNCGIMDQFASACGVKDRLLSLDCRSLEWKTISLPENVSIVIANTSVRRSLSGSAYNDRRAACEEAVRILQGVLPGIKSLRDVSVDAFNQHASMLPPMVEKRARHVVEEIQRTTEAIPLLEAGDSARFGELMDRCHISLRDLYEVSCPELDAMVSIANKLPGCLGARLTGAGFGGCTVNLVNREDDQAFAMTLAGKYMHKTGLRPEIYICRAADGAGVEEV